VSRYQKGKTNLNFTEARDSEWQWHQLGHMQVCTLLQTDNHVSTPPLSFLQAGCPSCRPTNSVKALKAKSVKALKANSVKALKGSPGKGPLNGCVCVCVCVRVCVCVYPIMKYYVVELVKNATTLNFNVISEQHATNW